MDDPNAHTSERKGGRRRSTEAEDTHATTDKTHLEASSLSSSSDSSSSSSQSNVIQPLVTYLSVHFGWVQGSLSQSKLKPVLRCAVVAWLSLVLFVIPKVQVVLGQASFLILIAIILSPPSDPFLSVLERELLILVFACLSWAWCCLGLFLADLSRSVHNPSATIFEVVDGRYIEAAPSIIIGVFITLGSATLVGFKAKQGPGPYIIPCILSCLVVNISLTTGALFPFPFYLIGKSILVPLSMHSALSLLGSLLIFPSTISALFTSRLQDTLSPCLTTLTFHVSLLSTPLTSPSFAGELAALRASTKKCETTLVPLAAARRLLHNDIIYGRFAPGDFVAFNGMLRRFAGRADGLSVFFSLVDPARERFPGVSVSASGIGPGHTAGNTPVGTPWVGLSRAPSLERIRSEDVGAASSSAEKGMVPLSPVVTSKSSQRNVAMAHPGLSTAQSAPVIATATSSGGPPTPTQALTPTHKSSHSVPHSHFHLHLVTSSPSTPTIHPNANAQSPQSPSHSRQHSHGHPHPHHHHHALLHSSLLALARARAKKKPEPEYAVGTFESQRYLNLEATTLWDPMEEEWNLRVGRLLKESCVPLLDACSVGVGTVKDWLSTVRDARLAEWFSCSSVSSFLASSSKGEEESKPKPTSSSGGSSGGSFEMKEMPSAPVPTPPSRASANGTNGVTPPVTDSRTNPDTNASENINADIPMASTSTPSTSSSASHSKNMSNLFGFSSTFGAVISATARFQDARKKREERIKKIKEVREEVARVLDEFRTVGRHAVLEPYRHVFEAEHDHDHDHDYEYDHGDDDEDRDHDAERKPGESTTRDNGYVPLDVDGIVHEQGDDGHGDRGRSRTQNREKEKEQHPQTPAHRYLFNCFVFQYNLVQIASIVLEMLDEIIRLEELRTYSRLWTPAERVFSWSPWLIADDVEHFGEDDDPDVIQGLSQGIHEESTSTTVQTTTTTTTTKRTSTAPNTIVSPIPMGLSNTSSNENYNMISPTRTLPSQRTGPAFDLSTSSPLLPTSSPSPSPYASYAYPPTGLPLSHADSTANFNSTPHLNTHLISNLTDLGLPKRRDPDALPPRNLLEWVMTLMYGCFIALWSDGMIFAIKAGLLTLALSLPSLIKGSAGFAYDNRFIWGIFMGQLTIARFRGDTIFGISARIISTFFGAIVGMVMWYISCGSGNGNPYGLAAVCAVCFPVIFFARIYWPIPPMRNIVFFVTIFLVIGYSYQDAHIKLPGIPGVGWVVAWKRFILVTAGVVSAFIASFFPPTTTIRLYQRRLLATTSSELGSIYCSILSFANTKHEPEIQEIIASLIAVRNKLNKSAVMVDNVAYEFSFRGRWPADRYRKIAELQVGISYSLSHLMSVLEHIEPSWARAFLRRTRFMDPGFQGDVLAVISMISSSLRTGNPLPQITPCPLIDRFMLKYHGLNVIHKDAEEDYGLPRTLSMETLRDEQYLMFSVGISTAFGIINRLDRLMIAVKEIVGEQYHIHGVGLARAQIPSENFPYGRPPPPPPPPSVNGSGAPSVRGVSGGGGPSGGGGVELGPRTNTVHFEPPV